MDIRRFFGAAPGATKTKPAQKTASSAKIQMKKCRLSNNRKLQQQNQQNPTKQELHDDEAFMETLAELDKSRKKSATMSISPDNKKKENGTHEKKPTKTRVDQTSPKKTREKSPTSSASPKKASPQKSKYFDKTEDQKMKKKIKLESQDKDEAKPDPKKAKKPSPVKTKTEKTPSPKKSPAKDSNQDAEKKPARGAYRAYLTREGPRALGTKEIPQGQENCLGG
uniref:Uncharacterized protein n=1 Tax=Branchiostoma floridae TaxID=7739 RepID=C3Y4Y4_BRAFL|eukprot:XP_002608781.1 hypothetical protein BRAFLDRAFT_110076 [Branchiostoma floridae]